VEIDIDTFHRFIGLVIAAGLFVATGISFFRIKSYLVPHSLPSGWSLFY